MYPNDIENIKENEIVDFRFKLMTCLNEQLIDNKKKASSKQNVDSTLFETIYSANLDLDPSLLDMSVAQTTNFFNAFSLHVNQIDIDILVQETNRPLATYTLEVELNLTPVDIVVMLIKKKLGASNQSKEMIDDIIKRYKDTYLLNICGCDEVLYGNKCPIGSYKVFLNLKFMFYLERKFQIFIFIDSTLKIAFQTR